MNSNNRELKWKLVKKGRSARKLSRRRWDAATKLGKLPSPKRVGDFSGSDSEKFGECFLGQSSPSNIENVPIKKRHCFPSLSIEQNSQHVCPSSHPGDFSGIELLAAAAASMTMNDDSNSGDKESPMMEDSSPKSKNMGSSIFASSEICLKSSESERGITEGPRVASACQSLRRNTDGGVLTKAVNHMHWDLNLPMDAWGEPYDSESKDDTNMETAQKESSDCVLSTAVDDTSTKAFDVKLEASGSIFSSQVKTEGESSGRTEAFDVKKEASVPIFSSLVKIESESSGTIKDEILLCDSIQEDEHHARSVCNAVDISKAEPADLQFQDSKSSCIQDGQSFLTCDSNPLEGPSRRSIDSLADEPTHSDGMFDFAKKSQQASDASQACDFVDGSNSMVIKEGYNSPYEDGEVRVSYMHSSDENECVDYESDGRNEHETYVTNWHELAQGGSEVCQGAKHIEAEPLTRSERSMEFTEKNIDSRKRSIMRRSSIEDDEPYFRVRRRMPSTQEVHWLPRPSRKDHSFPHDSGRSSRKHFPQRTHSGSRTWNYTSSRRRSRSPDYRFENRMERMKVPRLKQGSTPGYGDGYMPGSRNSQNKHRSFKYSAFPDKQVKRRRSPIRSFKRSQRYDKHLKSDEYYRSVNRSGRFSFAGSGNGHNIQSDYNDRRPDSPVRTIQRRQLAITNGSSIKQFERQNTDV